MTFLWCHCSCLHSGPSVIGLPCSDLSCKCFIPSSSLSPVPFLFCPHVCPLCDAPICVLFPFLSSSPLSGNPLCYISVFSPLPRPSVGSSNAVSDAIIMRRSTTVPIWGSNPRRWRSRRQNNNIKYTPPLACSPLLLSLQAVKIFTCSRLCSSIHSKAGGVHYSMTANVGSDDLRWHHSSDTWDTRELISCKAFFTFVPVYISRKKNIIMTKKRQIYQILSIFLLYSSI